jgi:hypothetical protein
MRKGTILAALVFVALIAVALLQLRKPVERGITHLSFTGLEKDKVTELSITGTNPIDLKKTDGKWVVSDGKPADENAVRMALDAISKIESDDVVTTNPERYVAMGVDEEKGTHIVAWIGSRHAAEFTLGSSAGANTHIRSGDAVYAVHGVRSFQLSKPSSAWHNLKLFTDALDDVSRVEVGLSGKAPYALVKKGTQWELEDPKVVPAGFRFDHDEARTLMSSLVNLGAKEILDKDPGVATTHLDNTADVLVFVGKDGARRELHLGATTAEKNVYARISGKDDLYTLTESAAKGLRKAPTDLRELTLVQLTPDKVRKLTVNAGKTQLVLAKEGSTWKVAHSSEPTPADFELDSNQVNSKISGFSTARALRLATEAEERTAGLAKPAATVTATLEDGKTVSISFGAEGKEKENNSPVVFARGSVDNTTYVVAKFLAERFTGGLSTFKKQAAPANPQFDASQLANLPPDIRAQLLQQLRQRTAQGAPGK